MTIHTAAGVYLTAYGYANVTPDPYDVHMDYLAYAAAENGYGYGYCYSIMYASNGRTQDWQLHEQEIINVEPEVGEHGFWPSIQYIIPEAADQLRCHMNQFWCAGGQIVFNSIEVLDGFLTPGESEELVVEVFNRGWGTSEAISFELTTTDPYVTLSTAVSSAGPLARRTSANNASNPFVADVSSSCPVGHEVEFTLTIDQGGYIRTEVFSLIVGAPVVFFADDAESGTGSWTISSDWGVDSSNPHGGNYSFNDSPGRDYYNNENCTITTSQSFNLTDATTVWLDYWARWDIESNYDFCQIEVSTNGSTWTPVAGLYTVAGSGIGVQSSGQPGYEGTQATWVHEHVDLNTYAGSPYLKFRFEFKSDGGVDGDGFFFDDLQLLGFVGSGTPGDVSIDLTYQSGSPVPAGGGTLYYDVFVENYGSVAVNYDAWLESSYEGGPPTTLVQRSFTNYLPGWTINRPNMWYPVPGSWAGGNYEFGGKVGIHPATAWDSSTFPFTKSGTSCGEFRPWAVTNAPDPFDKITKDGLAAPAKFALNGAFPNPFNPTTAISYQLSANSFVNLSVYDVSGRQVAELVKGNRNAGIHAVTFDASDISSGIYIYKLTAGEFTASGKMVLMK